MCTCRRHAVCPEHLGMLEPRVLEEWQTIDRWWTDAPENTQWRVIDVYGEEVVQVKRYYSKGWEEYAPEARQEEQG